MSIVSVELNGRSCRTYLLYDDVSREAILIDPVIDLVEEYIKTIDQTKMALTHIVDTHTHADHLSGGSILKQHTGCDYVMYQSSNVSGVSWRLQEGTFCRLGRDRVIIYHTPGHTKDSVSLVLPDRVFVGDLLFLDEGGAGRLDLPGGNVEEHWDSLQRILGLSDHLVVYPAHDYRGCSPSTIAVQKMRNQYLQSRTREEYVAFAKTLRYGPAEWMRQVLQLNEECSEMRMRAYVMPNVGNACENVCESSAANSISIPHISVVDFYAQYESSVRPVLLDVREADELVGDLPALSGIIHIPVGSLERRIQELDLHREELVVVICRSGKRALRAASLLTQAGFSNVSVLSGGMLAWVESGLPL
ncbi:MAG: MBL fold metallo-hydrolase [bacterium]|nr:MBL fold metallo-hydrolase [bacterium]MDZ4286172.1 MBL fold metallo-hydrolase [Candidatus Sungbacteria bacterium]